MATRALEICILGGTGFVGTELVNRLVRGGHTVRVPTRKLANGAHLRVLPTVQLVAANIHDVRVLAQLFSGVDVVINLVGILNQHGRATFRSAHTDLATKVVEAMRAQRVPRLLHMSALAAGAQAPSQYLRSKAEAEAQVRVAATAAGLHHLSSFRDLRPRDSLTNRFTGLLRLGRWLSSARAAARALCTHLCRGRGRCVHARSRGSLDRR